MRSPLRANFNSPPGPVSVKAEQEPRIRLKASGGMENGQSGRQGSCPDQAVSKRGITAGKTGSATDGSSPAAAWAGSRGAAKAVRTAQNRRERIIVLVYWKNHLQEYGGPEVPCRPLLRLKPSRINGILGYFEGYGKPHC